MSDTNDLEVLLPQGKQVTVQNANITITPFKFGELPRVFKAIDPISNVLFKSLSSGGNQANLITTIMSEGGDNILDLMAIGSRKPREWVDTLEMDEGVELLGAILEVNVSFFVQKVLPQINSKLEAVLPGQTQ
jgi:hypothetical protein